MTEYVCVASNGIPPDESWTVKLHVHCTFTFHNNWPTQRYCFTVAVPPTVVPVHDSVFASATAGSQLACRAEAWPRPEFHWTFQGNVLVEDPVKYKLVATTMVNYDQMRSSTTGVILFSMLKRQMMKKGLTSRFPF